MRDECVGTCVRVCCPYHLLCFNTQRTSVRTQTTQPKKLPKCLHNSQVLPELWRAGLGIDQKKKNKIKKKKSELNKSKQKKAHTTKGKNNNNTDTHTSLSLFLHRPACALASYSQAGGTPQRWMSLLGAPFASSMSVRETPALSRYSSHW